MSLSEVVASSRVVVCCGSGGVGKTTTAALVALHAAREGRRSVVVTIDPARRLANALGLDHLSDQASVIPGPWPGEMHALMLDTKATFDGLVQRYAADRTQAERILTNRFYANISGSLSGTQEYMASERLYELAIEDDYDLVVVDTPPSRNALDFIDSPQRLARFLDHRIYKVLINPSKGPIRAVNLAAAAVTRSLAKVVGADVIGDAIEFFRAFDGMEEGFARRADRVDALMRESTTSFILVASPKADTVVEAGYFADRLGELGIDVKGLVVNRMQPAFEFTTDRPELAGIAVRARAETLAGTPLGDLYTALADARQLAAAEEGHLVGIAEQVAPAPVVRVPIQPGEVNDLVALDHLADLILGTVPNG
ncbi:MAG: ArsA family ATPase [Actinobacteria bacterium]|nr:ArsA family ATPase [Actinomycetota bacterium]